MQPTGTSYSGQIISKAPYGPFELGVFSAEDKLPLVIMPSAHLLDPASQIEALVQHYDWIRSQINHYGAILLRGFEFPNMDALQGFLEKSPLDLMPYIGGVGLRGDPLQGLIYKSTNFPSHLDLQAHNEATYTNDYAQTLIFYCEIPSNGGGQTPLVDTREVYKKVDPGFRAKVEEKGMIYIRYLPKEKGKYLVGWPEIFDSKDSVASFCAANGIDYEWLEGETLVLRERMPAVVKNKYTQEPCWINQVTIFHRTFWSRKLDEIPAGLAPQAYPTHILLGDGSEFDEKDVIDVEKIWDAEKREFAWEQGDVLILDNEMLAHGRRPFEGDREIRVVLARN